VFVMDWIIAYF